MLRRRRCPRRTAYSAATTPGRGSSSSTSSNCGDGLPCEGSRHEVAAKPPSPTAWLPLMRLTALQGIVNVRLAEPLGSPHPRRPRRFRRDPRFPPYAVPRLLALTGSSPRELRSSSESSASHPPSLSPAPAPSLGLRSLFATSPTGVRATGIPTPAAFPSSAFRTPATVCSACRLVGLFHPTATSRVRPSGNSLAHSRAASSASRALSSLGAAALPRLPEAPHVVAPPSGLSSVRESVASMPGFSRRRSSIPSWVSPPPGAPSRRRADAFTPAAAHDLDARSSLSLAHWPAAFTAVEPDILSRGCRPARGSLPAAHRILSSAILGEASAEPKRVTRSGLAAWHPRL